MSNHANPQAGYETLDTLFRHNLWANTLLFERCAGLSDEQLDFSILGTFGSIRATLQHIAYSEQSYLHRITTGKPLRRPQDAPPPTLAELQEWIRLSGEGLIAAAPGVQAQDSVEVDWDGTLRAVPCAILLTQAINHATEHRSQVLVTLTQLGIQPPELDGWSYFDAVDE
jgi:uncharacterized damage-inducible protein DinB